METIAHLSDGIENQVLADFRNLQDFVATQLGLMVRQKIDDAALNGDGTGAIEGILEVDGTIPIDSTDHANSLDAVFAAAQNVREANLEPDAIGHAPRHLDIPAHAQVGCRHGRLLRQPGRAGRRTASPVRFANRPGQRVPEMESRRRRVQGGHDLVRKGPEISADLRDGPGRERRRSRRALKVRARAEARGNLAIQAPQGIAIVSGFSS